jgi:protease YdgD
MRRAALCLALALLAGAHAPAARAEALDRLTLRDARLGWEGVGRLDVGGRGYCTGTLIAPDVVLTAAHCLFDAKGAALPGSAFTFRAGYTDGSAIAEAVGARAVAHPRYDPAAGTSVESLRHDVGLVGLERAIPAAMAAPFPVAPAGGDAVSVVSYGAGRDEAPSWQRRCAIIGRYQGLFAFDCAAVAGSSGAPVFDRSGPRARIVSVISSGGEVDGRAVAVGMELPGLVAALRSALRSAPAAPPAGARWLAPGGADAAAGARFLRPPASEPPAP